MKDKGTHQKRLSLKMILIGLGLAMLFWILHATIESYVFHEGTFFKNVLLQDLPGLWEPLLVVFLLIGFGIYSQAIITRRNRAEDALQKARCDLATRVDERTSELERANEELRQSEKYFRALIDDALDAIVVLNSDGTIRYRSPSYQRVTGYDPEERVGESGFEHVHPDDVQDAMEKFGQLLQETSSTMNTEIRSLHKDGSWRRIEVSGRNLIDDPVVAGVVATFRDVTERKQAEEALKESEEKFRSLSEHSPNMIFINKNGRVVYANEKCEQVMGYKRNEFYSPDFDFMTPIAPESRDLIGANYIKNMKGEEVAPYEYALITKDGKKLDAILTTVLIPYEGESAILGTITDITERKRMEEALRVSEEYYRALMENAQDAIIVIDANGIICFTNPTFERIVGEDRTGKNPFEFVHPDDMANAVQSFNDLIQNPGATVNMELRGQHNDGSWRNYEVIGKKLIDDHVVTGIVATFRDVTEHKLMEEELRESEKHYSALVRNLTEAVFKFKGGEIVWCNDRVEEIYGYKVNELIGKKASFFYPDNISASEFNKAILNGMKKHGHFHSITKFQKKDGSITDVEYAISQIPDEDPIELVAVARDITEQVQANEEIRRLNKELEQRVIERTTQLEVVNKELETFAYSVSHDLRAPLRSIDGFSQILLEDYTDKVDAQGKDYLQRVRSASQRMAQLIDDILNLSRVTRSEMRHDKVDLSALALTAAMELQQSQPERQVEFVITPELVTDGDAHLLQVVLQNLLGNAWKFTGTHEHATIEFGYTETNGQPAYFVRDDGVGFDMAYSDKLFGAFQRLHSPYEFEGTGIGLATVQRIVNRHGGDVWAESAVEQGATFYFTL